MDLDLSKEQLKIGPPGLSGERRMTRVGRQRRRRKELVVDTAEPSTAQEVRAQEKAAETSPVQKAEVEDEQCELTVSDISFLFPSISSN